MTKALQRPKRQAVANYYNPLIGDRNAVHSPELAALGIPGRILPDAPIPVNKPVSLHLDKGRSKKPEGWELAAAKASKKKYTIFVRKGAGYVQQRSGS